MKKLIALILSALLAGAFLVGCAIDIPAVSTEQINGGGVSVTTVPSQEAALDPYCQMLRSASYYANGMESGAFTYLVYTSSRNDTGYVIIKAYTGSDSSVVIPDSLDGYPVIGFYHSIFENSDFVSEIHFPDTLRTVIFNTRAELDTCMTNTVWYGQQPEGVCYAGAVAIGYKGQMAQDTVLTFREGTVAIGGGAFRLYKTLTGVELPESMLLIGGHAFGGSGLRELTVPATLQCYDGAFGTCLALERVSFGEGIECIQGAFSGCERLEQVQFPETLTEIEDGAFFGCEALTQIVLPQGTKYIGERAFADCGLTAVTLNDGLYDIGDEAFNGCKALKSIYIPASVKSFGIYSLGFNDEKLYEGFVAYFEEETQFMEYLTKKGVDCRLGSPEQAQ